MDYHLDKDEAINGNEMIDALKRSDHFYITHYCKKRDTIEKRRCFWDSKSKIWETKTAFRETMGIMKSFTVAFFPKDIIWVLYELFRWVRM